jgi:hypothetical protein
MHDNVKRYHSLVEAKAQAVMTKKPKPNVCSQMRRSTRARLTQCDRLQHHCRIGRLWNLRRLFEVRGYAPRAPIVR